MERSGIGRPPTCVCGTCQKCKHRAYMRSWNAKRPGYAAAQARAHRERAANYERDRYHADETFKAKKKARNMVSTRLARGTMVRQPCEVCAAAGAQAHHDDYSRPLDVRWLCPQHHAQWHAENDPRFAVTF